MSALPSDTACESAWDKDSGRFYDDDTGWSQRGYEAGFAAGATWGAEWYAGHMAVCEFLADLARIYAQCPRCSGFGEYNVARGYRDPARYVRCYFCRGSGKRVTP